MKSICYIVGAGEYSSRFRPDENSYILAADAGYSALIENGIKPDLLVGDYDSLVPVPDFANKITVPAEKNDTDMALAVRLGLEAGYKLFIINGGIGGRLDHTLSNIQLLKELNLNKSYGILLGKDICITAITNDTLEIKPGTNGVISVFTLGEKAEGVTLEGLKYPLDNYTMVDNYPIGVSNEFTGKPARIFVQNGTVIITWTEAPVTITFENNEQITI